MSLELVESASRAGSGSDDAPVLAYPETAILELAHVAAWLRISERQVERLDIPFALLGKRTKRYLARDVIGYLERKRIFDESKETRSSIE